MHRHHRAQELELDLTKSAGPGRIPLHRLARAATPLAAMQRRSRAGRVVQRHGAQSLPKGGLRRSGAAPATNVRRMTALVDTCWTISRLSEGRLTLDRKEMDLGR